MLLKHIWSRHSKKQLNEVRFPTAASLKKVFETLRIGSSEYTYWNECMQRKEVIMLDFITSVDVQEKVQFEKKLKKILKCYV